MWSLILNTETLYHRHLIHATIIAVIYIMVKEWSNPKYIHPSFLTKLILHLEHHTDLCPPHSAPNLRVWPRWKLLYIVTLDWNESLFSPPHKCTQEIVRDAFMNLCTIIQDYELRLPMAKSHSWGEVYFTSLCP